MSIDIERELRGLFDSASEQVIPRPELAALVRRATRRRRRRVVAAATLAAAATGVITGYAAGVPIRAHGKPKPAVSHRGTQPAGSRLLIELPGDAQVLGLAVAVDGYLYVATNYATGSPYVLTVYGQREGPILNRVDLPAAPGNLTLGRNLSVWLAIDWNGSGGPCQTWLLTRLLWEKSTAHGCGAFVPTGTDTAIAADGLNGTLDRIVPSSPAGHVSRSGNLGNVSVDSLALAGGRVAALVTDGYGNHGRVVLAGKPGLSFGGDARQQAASMAAQGDRLWVTTVSTSHPSAGPLALLDANLRAITPRVIVANPLLRRSEQVWTRGETVFVATAVPGHRLVCFRSHGTPGLVATIPVLADPSQLAASQNNVYVTVATGPSVTPNPGVYAYPVPPACR